MREQEKEIQRRLEFRMSKNLSNMKLYDCFEEYLNNKVNIKESTRQNYDSMLNVLKEEDFCQLTISQITTTKAKRWFISMNQTRRYSRLKCIKSMLSSMFKSMIESEQLQKNPFSFDLSSLIKKDCKKRESLTEKEEIEFLNYLQNSKYKKYYDEFYFLLNTGLRISEFCGLTLSDIDFENKTITIDSQLSMVRSKRCIQTKKKREGYQKDSYYSGIGILSHSIIKKRKIFNKPCTIDGKTDFLFLNCHNKPTDERSWNSKLKTIVNNYNKTYPTKKLPEITPHILRHTYCSKMIKKEFLLRLCTTLWVIVI